MGPKSKKKICRVPWGALGKVGFAECWPRGHSAKLIFKNKKKFAECLTLALGKISFKKLKKNFAECPRFTLGKISF